HLGGDVSSLGSGPNAAQLDECPRPARVARGQAQLDTGDASLERRARPCPALDHRQEVARQRLVAAVVALALRGPEAVAVGAGRVVVVDGPVGSAPVELARAPISDEPGAARGRAAPRVEVLRVDGVRARGVLDQRARRVVVAGVRREGAEPAVDRALLLWAIIPPAVDAAQPGGHV